jgi:hypothetical protein
VYRVVELLFTAGNQVPVMLFVEVAGKVNVPPAHIGATCVKIGVTGVFTTTVKVAVVAHGFPVGVNVYAVVVLLFIAGAQLPETPFVEVVGKVIVPPTQIGAIAANVGVTLGFTVTVNVAVVPHCPAVGVNVYVVVVVLFIAGLHVPVTPFVDVVGNVKLPPLQIGAMGANCVVTDGVTVTVRVAAAAHCPAVGVNVYVVVALLLNAGLQVPLILFVDVNGNATTPPLQMVVSGLTMAVAPGAFTVTVMVAVVAHKPAVGVNV